MTNEARIDILDGWRGVAIALVLAGHFVPGLGLDGGYNAGRAGVEVFFALSGTLIGRQLFVDTMPLREFALRRAARLLPAMWIFIVAAALLFGAAGGALWLDLAGLANFTANPVPLQHLWSVSLELQGYLLLALLAFASRRTGLPAPALLLVATAVAWASAGVEHLRHADGYELYWWPPFRLTAMLLAAAFTTRFAAGAVPHGRWFGWALLGLALQAHAVPDIVKYTLGSAALAHAAAALAVQRGGWLARWLSSRPLVWLGAVSYSIYLWQQPVYHLQPLPGVLNIALAIALGALAHRFWDGPAHHAARRLLSRWTLRPAPSATR